MRCHYLSDLHLETQDLNLALPHGDVLIVAGDTCHARCLNSSRTDRYSQQQRSRVARFFDQARKHFAHVLLIAGNHDHYDGLLDETAGLFARYLPGITFLDNSEVEIGGVRFFGATLWSNFQGRNPAAMAAVRRRMGEYFFVKQRVRDAGGSERFIKFAPEAAAELFDAAWLAVKKAVSVREGKPLVVITHHAPSLGGLNPLFAGNGLDGAYASALDHEIAGFEGVPFWVHGHTHIRRRYRIGGTQVLVNCRGFEKNDPSARTFSAAAYFEV